MSLNFNDLQVAAAEIEFAERENEKKLAAFRHQLNAYTTPFFSSDSEDGSDMDALDYSPENHYFDYVATVVPLIAYSNPKTAIGSRRIGPQEKVAEAIKFGMDRWIVDTNFQAKAARWAVDYLFNFAAAHVSLAENWTMNFDRDTDVPLWPEVNRLSQRDVFRDPMAKSRSEVRYVGHSYVIDQEDLLAIAKDENDALGDDEKDLRWDVDAIESVPATSSVLGDGEYPDDAPDRQQILVKEVWVAGYEDENHPGAEAGYHGSVFIYGFAHGDATTDSMGEMLRGPVPYYGPVTGPYVLSGVYFVPDSPFELAPLVAAEGQVRDLNRHAVAMSESAARRKNLLLVDSSDPAVASKVQNAGHEQVIMVNGLDKDRLVTNVAIGGVDREWIEYFALAKGRLDRGSGMSDAVRGNVSGDGTATENAIANQASDSRMAWIKLAFNMFIEEILTTVAWYMYHNDEVQFPLGRDAAEALEMLDGPGIMFQGGNPSTEDGASYADLELSIEPMSMEHTSEATLQRRALQTLEIMTTVASIAPASPFLDWPLMLKIVGNGLNLEKLPEIWKSEVYEQVVGIAMESQAEGSGAMLGKHAKGGGQATERPSMQFGGTGGLPGQSMGAELGASTGSSSPVGAA